MPFIVLTLSAAVAERLAIVPLLEDLARTLGEQESVDPTAIKTYAQVADPHVMGHGAPRDFVHVEIRLMTGRSSELRNRIADRCYGVLQECAEQLGLELSVTQEIREMDAGTYRKMKIHQKAE